MTPAAADWVYDVVLTQRYKESNGAIMWTGAGKDRRDEGAGPAFLARCACQYGPCGYCCADQHQKCSHRDWRPGPSPETYVQNQRGLAVAQVWMSGKACAWRCSCRCPVPEVVVAVVEPEPAVVQLELFALAGGAS